MPYCQIRSADQPCDLLLECIWIHSRRNAESRIKPRSALWWGSWRYGHLSSSPCSQSACRHNADWLLIRETKKQPAAQPIMAVRIHTHTHAHSQAHAQTCGAEDSQRDQEKCDCIKLRKESIMPVMYAFVRFTHKLLFFVTFCVCAYVCVCSSCTHTHTHT